MKRHLIRRLFRFTSRTNRDVRRDIDEEFQFHLDMRIEDLRREGLDEAAARAQALREFGDAARGADACAVHGETIERQRWLTRIVSELRQDSGYGLRLIRRSPGFSAAAIATLAIAIGGNTAIFSIVNALVFRPAPYGAPDGLARIHTGESQTSWLNYQDIASRTRSFRGVAAHRGTMISLATDAEPVRLNGQTVTPNFFDVLGVHAALGRTFLTGDTRTDVVVVSDRVWRTQFSSDPAIVGRTIVLDGRRYEILAVMPRLFRGVAPPGLLRDCWFPIDPAAPGRGLEERNAGQFEIIGRLAPGVTHEQATAELRVIAAQLRAEHPEIPERFAATRAMHVDGIDAFQGVARTLLPVFAFVGLLWILAGLVLAIGCANLAGLLLGRGVARCREIAVRLALGSGRGRLVRQLLTESLVLAMAGGAAGLMLANWLSGLLNVAAARLPFPVEFDLALDPRVLVYTIGLSMATAVVFGLVPARRASRIDLVPALKDETGGRRQRLRSALVIGQIAMCSLLLAWAGLFARSLQRAVAVDPGFDAAGVLVAELDLGDVPDKARMTESLVAELQPRLERMPGVESVGVSSIVPLALTGREAFRITLDDPSADRPWVMGNRLTPGWFRALGIPMRAGRDFRWDDREGAPGVAIVNETLARRLGPGAIGMRLKWPDVEIVGVVADSKYYTIGETIAPALYRPFRQHPGDSPIFHIRTSDLAGTARALRAELRRLAPAVAPDIKPMTAAVAVATMPARVGAIFSGGFGVLAALLAALGIYGLVSFNVAQRQREIGVRKAIGAGTPRIISLIVGDTAVLAGAGLAVGLIVAVAAGQLLRGFIVEVSPADPLTLGGVVALVAASSLAASLGPALRAARIDPLATLRAE